MVVGQSSGSGPAQERGRHKGGHRLRGRRGAVALAGLCVTAACGSPSPAAPGAGGTARVTSPAASRSPASPAAPGRRAATATAAPAPPPAPHVILSRVRTADGSVITVAAFRGPVQYVLHNGSGDPGAAAAALVSAGPAVTGAERQRLLAVFNGGFKLSAGTGGYEQEGHVIAALRPGLASLVIDRSGQARMGIWGASVPAPGEAVYSVRQNLQPLVCRGQPATAAAQSPLRAARHPDAAHGTGGRELSQPGRRGRPGGGGGAHRAVRADIVTKSRAHEAVKNVHGPCTVAGSSLLPLAGAAKPPAAG